MTTRIIRLPIRLLLLLALAVITTTAVLAAVQPALNDYNARMPTFRAQLPAVITSAKNSAAIVLAHPEANLDVPYWEQMSFAEEMMNRAGGLTSVLPTGGYGRPETKYDIVLLSVRSWALEKDLIVKRVKEYKAKGWTVTVFASQAGKPKELDADFFIDNGASSGKAELARINVLANVTLGWMWCCEYAATMSRQGKFPAILYSVGMPGAQEYDAKIQTPDGRHTLLSCPTAIPEGELATAYLQRIEKLTADMAGDHVQGQLLQAADVVAKRLAAGGTVGIAGMGHVIIEEVMHDNKTPWLGFRVVGSVDIACRTHLKPGDLLVWMTYAGMNSAYDDYAKYIAEAKLDLVTCYAQDPVWAKDPPPTLAHIDQSWQLPDSEVPIPVFPNVMAPVSGINVTLLARMLDDEVSARLKAMHVKIKPVDGPLAPELCDRGGERFYPYESGGAPVPARKWGFVNTAGKEVVPPQFDSILPMTEGMAAVCRSGKWGYVDGAGASAVAPFYDAAAPFSGGVAKVGLNGKFGYIDKAGKVVVPLDYDQLEEPNMGYGYSAPMGVTAVPGFAMVRTGKLWGLIAKSGQVLVPPKYEAMSNFSDKAVVVRQGGKYGLISSTGDGLLAATYDSIGRFRNGFATMQLNGKVGALDGAGKVIVAPQYESIGGILGDMVVIRTGAKWGVVSKAGAEIIPPKYDQIGRFSDGLASVRNGKLWGAIDADGKEVVMLQYEDMRNASEGMIPVKRGGKWGYLDKTGAPVIEAKYDTVNSFNNGSVLVKQDDRWCVVDKTGKELALPKYDYLGNGGEGFFKVVRNGKWGVIDSTGKEIVPPKYSYVLSFNQGRALVAARGKWDETAGKIPLLVGAKWGLIDKTGHEIVKPKYDRITPFGDSVLAVGVNTETLLPIP